MDRFFISSPGTKQAATLNLFKEQKVADDVEQVEKEEKQQEEDLKELEDLEGIE